MTALARLHDAITRGGFVLGAACVGGMAALYVLEVGMRYFVGAPTRWTADFVVYLMCWSVFLCLPEVTRAGGHVAISAFVDKLPEAARRMAVRAIAFVSALAMASAAAIVAEEAVRQYEWGVKTLAAVPIPRWWLMAAIAHGFGSSALHLLRHAARTPGRLGTEFG